MSAPVVLLHGFLGRGADWDAVRDGLPASWDVRAPDLPGHGAASGLAPEAHTMGAGADRALAGLDRPADVVGYSMGGRLALHLAVTRPRAVRRVVVVSGSPGLPTADERAARRATDAARAAEVVADLLAFVDRWYRMPLWHTLPDDLRRRLTADRAAHNDPTGLAASLVGMGTGAQPSHWGALASLAVPVWAVAGALDPKFAEVARRMADAGPVRPVVVPGAGHMMTAEAPGPLAAVVRDALG